MIVRPPRSQAPALPGDCFIPSARRATKWRRLAGRFGANQTVTCGRNRGCRRRRRRRALSASELGAPAKPITCRVFGGVARPSLWPAAVSRHSSARVAATATTRPPPPPPPVNAPAPKWPAGAPSPAGRRKSLVPKRVAAAAKSRSRLWLSEIGAQADRDWRSRMEHGRAGRPLVVQLDRRRPAETNWQN